MYDSLVGHLVRRGVHAGMKCGGMKGAKEPVSTPGWLPQDHGVHGFGGNGGHGHHDPLEDLIHKLRSPGAVVTVLSTIAAILFVDFIIHYTLGNVALNLAIAEDPEPTGAIQLPANDSEFDPSIAKAPLLKDGGNGTVVIEEFGSAKPITSSLRGTLRQIRSISGFRSYFRGLHYALFYKLIFFSFFGVFSSIFHSIIGRVIAILLTSVLTCNLHAAWTHATVAAPSEYTRSGFFTRFLHRNTAKHLILPTIRYLLAINLVGVALSRIVHNSIKLAASEPEKKALIGLGISAAVLLCILGFFGAIVPAHVALIRSELSYLPEDVPTVVPLDRTFGGRVDLQEQTAGTWKSYIFRNLSLRGAYATMDCAVYKRVIKMVFKTVGILFSVWFISSIVLFAELYVFVGKEAKAVAIAMRNAH